MINQWDQGNMCRPGTRKNCVMPRIVEFSGYPLAIQHSCEKWLHEYVLPYHIRCSIANMKLPVGKLQTIIYQVSHSTGWSIGFSSSWIVCVICIIYIYNYSRQVHSHHLKINHQSYSMVILGTSIGGTYHLCQAFLLRPM